MGGASPAVEVSACDASPPDCVHHSGPEFRIARANAHCTQCMYLLHSSVQCDGSNGR